jgi:hypothetical protein
MLDTEFIQRDLFAIDPNRVVRSCAEDKGPVALCCIASQGHIAKLAIPQKHDICVFWNQTGSTLGHIQVVNDRKMAFLTFAYRPSERQGTVLIANSSHQHLAMVSGGASVQDDRDHMSPTSLQKRSNERRIECVCLYFLVLQESTLPLFKASVLGAKWHFAGNAFLVDASGTNESR